MMSVLHFFSPTQAVVDAYDVAYHGSRYSRFCLWSLDWLSGSTFFRTRESIHDLLGEAVHGSLLELFSSRKMEKGLIRFALSRENEEGVVRALMRQLPQIDTVEKHRIASLLFGELKKALADGSVLTIDGGQVSIQEDWLVASVNMQME